MRIGKPTPLVAGRQAAWLVGQEPWRSLGYEATPLARWLARKARAGQVRCVTQASGGAVTGLIVVQPDVLLGHFIALLAVIPAALGQGVGRALVEDAAVRARQTQARWLYASSDADNRPAARFYRKLGFAHVATLPDLIRDGRKERLWRRSLR